MSPDPRSSTGAGTGEGSDPGGPAGRASAYPPVLTAAMAAELLQVHVESLRRMVREGRVPCHRFPGGRELRFLRDELLDWLACLPSAAQGTGRTQLTDATGR